MAYDKLNTCCHSKMIKSRDDDEMSDDEKR